jgi:polyferredoxin
LKKVLEWWKEYAYILMLFVMVVGLFYPKIMLVFIFCMLGPSLTGVWKGRFWCGNICPIGNFFDKLTVKLSNHKKAPDLFKSKYIRILFTSLMMTMFVFEMISAIGNPIMTGMIFYEMILEAVIIGSFLAVIYHHRVWCHFCPMGSTGALATYYSKKKKVLAVSLIQCSECKKCEEQCPMGLIPYKSNKGLITSYDCIQCGLCKITCPKHAINYPDYPGFVGGEVYGCRHQSAAATGTKADINGADADVIEASSNASR